MSKGLGHALHLTFGGMWRGVFLHSWCGVGLWW